MCESTFDMFLRNYWGLWENYTDNLLVRDFYRLGIWHPDDMSILVLTSYYRVYNNHHIKLREQIENTHQWYKDFYKMNVDTLVAKIQRLAHDS